MLPSTCLPRRLAIVSGSDKKQTWGEHDAEKVRCINSVLKLALGIWKGNGSVTVIAQFHVLRHVPI